MNRPEQRLSNEEYAALIDLLRFKIDCESAYDTDVVERLLNYEAICRGYKDWRAASVNRDCWD